MAATNLQNTEAGSRDSPDGFRLGHVSVLAGVIGAAAAVIAYFIYHFIGLLYNLFFYQRLAFRFIEPPNSGLPLWIVFVPALGGLIAGLMAQYGSRRIIGHGIPEAMEAVWSNESRVKPRILILKPISAAIAIGTGAPFGVEGPIIQSGGAMGSVFGQWISTTVVERKVLLACGAAAGMAATFNTPLAGILVAIELLVFEFRARSFVPISIASLIATGARHPLIGSEPMFLIEQPFPIEFFPNLPFLIGLGIIIGGAAIIFKDGYFWAEEYIHRVPVNDIILPAIGGLILGVMGLLVPRTFGVGYEVAHEILVNDLPVTTVLLVMIFKVVGVYVTLGSKTSGGFLAPVFVAGAAIGSVFAHGVNVLVPGVSVPVTLFALAGLGTLFGVVSNATFGFTLFAIEVTGQYEAILPVFLVGVVADAVATLYMESDLMTAELSDRGIDVHQDYEIDVLKRFKANEVMDEAPATLDPDVSVAQLAATIAETDDSTQSPAANDELETMLAASESITEAESIELVEDSERTIHDGFPIVDSDGSLVGIITYGDLVRAIARDQADRTVGELGTRELVVGHPDERLFETVVRMAENDIEQLPIVPRTDETELIGWLDSQNLMTSALRQLDEERVREEGSLSGYVNLLTAKSR